MWTAASAKWWAALRSPRLRLDQPKVLGYWPSSAGLSKHFLE
jgi:hypothetical protein